MRLRWMPIRVRSKSASATKSRSLTASRLFSKRPANPRSAATPSGSSGQRRAGQRAGAERRDVEPAAAVEQPVDVAGQRPAVGQQVVGQQRRAGPAAGACSRAGRRRPTSTARSSSTSCRPATRAATSVSARLAYRRRSVATWSLRLRPVWSLAPAGAGQLGDPALDGGVDVLVGGRERERARRRARPRRRRARRAPPPPRRRSRRPARARPRTWAREPAMSSGARRWSNGRLTV